MTRRELIYIGITLILALLLGGFVGSRHFCNNTKVEIVNVIDTLYYTQPDTVILRDIDTLVIKEYPKAISRTIVKRDTVFVKPIIDTFKIEEANNDDVLVEIPDSVLSALLGNQIRYAFESSYEFGSVFDTITVYNSTIIDKQQSILLYDKVQQVMQDQRQNKISAGAFYQFGEQDDAFFGLSLSTKKDLQFSYYRSVLTNSNLVGVQTPIIKWPK